MHHEENKSSYDSQVDAIAMRQIIGQAEEQIIPGVVSGLIALDRVTKGWKKSALTVIAGPPSMGCTSLLLACMRNAVVDFHIPTAFFSLQLSRQQLLTKWLSAAAEIPYDKIETGNLHEHEWLKINTASAVWDRHAEEYIRVLDDANPTIEKVMEDCRRLREEGVSQFLIDNLSRIRLGKESRSFCANREQEVSHIIRCLKTLSRELDAPVIVVAHLNRLNRGREFSHRPQLGDLRDSGTVEYEADVIILLHRLEYYRESEDEMGNPTLNVAELIVAKNAFGSAETVQVEFKSACGRFSNLEGFDGRLYEGNEFDDDAARPFKGPNSIHVPPPFPRSSFGDGPPPF